MIEFGEPPGYIRRTERAMAEGDQQLDALLAEARANFMAAYLRGESTELYEEMYWNLKERQPNCLDCMRHYTNGGRHQCAVSLMRSLDLGPVLPLDVPIAPPADCPKRENDDA
jgi:hypothetical protein